MRPLLSFILQVLSSIIFILRIITFALTVDQLSKICNSKTPVFQICCPKAPKILFPGDPGTPGFKPDEDYEDLKELIVSDEDFCGSVQGGFDYKDPNEEDSVYNGNDYDYDDQDAGPSQRCTIFPGTDCRLASNCGPSDFNNSKPPAFCGVDKNSGENKLCCSGSEKEKVESPQKPQFTIQNRPWPCEDQTKECARWLESDPKVCNPDHITFGFMRFGCMKTCNICGEQVCFLCFYINRFFGSNPYKQTADSCILLLLGLH